eukprot:4484356-Alexandrium_andersonii.AAC.1
MEMLVASVKLGVKSARRPVRCPTRPAGTGRATDRRAPHYGRECSDRAAWGIASQHPQDVQRTPLRPWHAACSDA